MSKTKVAVIFGGRSVEHEVSRISAYTVTKSLMQNFDVFPIGISHEGEWYGPIPLEDIQSFTPQKHQDCKVTFLPTPISQGRIYTLPNLDLIDEAQVIFPIVHGSFGEDGTLQGLLDILGIPYVGSSVLASALGIDKLMMKKMYAHAGLPQVPYLGYDRPKYESEKEEEGVLKFIPEIERILGYPCFVKPHNLGSSVGISKANNSQELAHALEIAFTYSDKVIVEKGVTAREIEVAILGNDKPRASIPGEIISSNAFYDYNAKYLDNKSQTQIPAQLDETQKKRIQDLAISAHTTLGCSGLSRVDFFVTQDTGDIFINEINTLPGFTSISMYPILWEKSGLPLDELTAELVRLAEERYQSLKENVTSYEK